MSEHIVKTRPGATIVVLILVYRVYTLPFSLRLSLSFSFSFSSSLFFSLFPSFSYFFSFSFSLPSSPLSLFSAHPFSLFLRCFSTHPLPLHRLTACQSIALQGSLVRLLFCQVRRKRLEDHAPVSAWPPLYWLLRPLSRFPFSPSLSILCYNLSLSAFDYDST